MDKEEDKEEIESHGVVYESQSAVGQVTIRRPVTAGTPLQAALNIIALSYGFLPWIVPVLFVGEIIVDLIAAGKVHMFCLWSLGISGVVTVLNEAILKPILKQPRPEKTANRYPDGSRKPGMPSGHVYNATALMVWLLCETIGSGPGWGGVHRSLTLKYLLVIIVLMGPVPWARWYNYDHTAQQCGVSLILGTITGTLAFFIRVNTISPWCEPWEDHFTQCPYQDDETMLG